MWSDHHVAHQHEYRVLALDLSGVDAALDEHHHFAGLGRGVRSECAVLRDDQRDHGAPLGRGADSLHFDEARGALQAVRDLDGFGVRCGLVPIGLFAGGQQVGGRRLGAGRERGGGLGGRGLNGGVRRNRILSVGQANGK